VVNRRARYGDVPLLDTILAMTVKEILAQLESRGDEGRRKYNAKTGPDGIPGVPVENQFGVKTGDLRKLAKKIKTPRNHELAQPTKHVRAALGLHPQLVRSGRENEIALWDRHLPEARYVRGRI
jgi:hypothetical protein